MSRIPLTSIEHANPAIQPVLADIQRRSLTPGRLLNIHAQMAHAPAVFAAYAGMRRVMEELGTLDFKTRTAIMLTASVANQAEYPIAIQEHLAARAGWTAEEIDALRDETFNASPKLVSLLCVGREAARNGGRVEQPIWDAAIVAGWTASDLAETFANVAFASMLDAFSHFAQPDFDVPDRARRRMAGRVEAAD